jgi:hypothetical protein
MSTEFMFISQPSAHSDARCMRHLVANRRALVSATRSARNDLQTVLRADPNLSRELQKRMAAVLREMGDVWNTISKRKNTKLRAKEIVRH